MVALKLMILCALVIASECAPGFPLLGEGIGIGAGLYPGGFGLGIGNFGGMGGMGGVGGMYPGMGYGLMGYKDKEGADKNQGEKDAQKPRGPIKLEPHNNLADDLGNAAGETIAMANKAKEGLITDAASNAVHDAGRVIGDIV